MGSRTRWLVFGAASVLLGSLTAAQSYSQAVLANSGTLQVTAGQDALITTPLVVTVGCDGQGPCANADPTAGSDSPGGPSVPADPTVIAAVASLTNNTDNTVLVAAVTSQIPYVSAALQPVSIASGDAAQVPVQFTISSGGPAEQVNVPLRFLFTWPSGQAAIDTQVSVDLTSPSSPPSP